MPKDQILEEFHHACRNVIDNSDRRTVSYAVNYAKHGLTITDLDEAKTQAMYILGNITHWRGSIAKESRSIFKNTMI